GPRQPAETEIEAGAPDALGLVDIDECRAQAGDLRRESDLAGAQVVIIIFDETGEDVGKGIFAADNDGPARARLARRIRGPEEDGRGPIFVALPRRTAPDVAEQATPGVADAAGHARQRLDLAVIGDADLARTVMAALGIGPGIVALDADHKAAGELIVATGLRAAQPAVQRVFAERLPVKRAAGRAHDPVLRLRPQTARMAADVAAAPAPNRNDRRRLVDGKAHVGRDRRTRQRDQRGRCEQESPHHLAPAMRGAVCNARGVDRCSRSATPMRICEVASAVVGNRDLARCCPVGLIQHSASTCVTRGLDHASRVYPTCALKRPKSGRPDFEWSIILRKDFLRRGWIAGSKARSRASSDALCPAMTKWAKTPECAPKKCRTRAKPELGQHYNAITHFSLDTRNENLPEKHIHQNCAEAPGRDTAPGFLLRGRDAPARGVFVRIETKERKPCSFKKAKAEIPPAGRAGRATGRRSCCKT